MIDRADNRPADDPEHGQQRKVDGEHVERVAPVEPARAAALGRAAPPGRQLPVVEHRVGDDLHPVAGRLHPPAEVEVVAEQPEPGVEPAELIPHVAPDEHARRAHGEHGLVVVVLTLVDLARLDAGDPAARPVDGDAHLAQRSPVLAVEHLGPEHHDRTVPAGRPQQPLKRLRGRLAVVVQQPDPLDPGQVRVGLPGAPPGGVPKGDRDRLAVAGGPLHAEDRVLPDQLGQHGPAAIPASGVHPDHLVDRIGLRLERLDEAGQQASAVMRDDERGNGVPGLRCGS